MDVQDMRLHTDQPNCLTVENRFGFTMAPEEVALEHCEIDNVAVFSVEFERVDGGESPQRQLFEQECENGGERDRSEEARWLEMDQW